MADVDPDVAEHLGAELAAHELPGPALAVLQVHVRAQAARPHVRLAADPTTVRPPVRVRVHVVAKVLLELEVVVAHVTPVPRLPEAGPRGRGALLLPARALRRQRTAEQKVVRQAAGGGGRQRPCRSRGGHHDHGLRHNAAVFLQSPGVLLSGFLGLGFHFFFAVFTLTNDTFPPFPLKCQHVLWALSFPDSSLCGPAAQLCFVAEIQSGGGTKSTLAGALLGRRRSRCLANRFGGCMTAFCDGGCLVTDGPEPRQRTIGDVPIRRTPAHLGCFHPGVGEDGQFTSGDWRDQLNCVAKKSRR